MQKPLHKKFHIDKLTNQKPQKLPFYLKKHKKPKLSVSFYTSLAMYFYILHKNTKQYFFAFLEILAIINLDFILSKNKCLLLSNQ